MNRSTLAIKYGSFLVILLVFSGCFKNIDFDRTAHSNIRKIGVLWVDEPADIAISGGYSGEDVPVAGGRGTGLATLGKVGAAVGSIAGGLLSYFIIQKPTKEKRSKVFLKAKDENLVFFGPAMVKSLRQELTRVGYDFIYLKDQPGPSSYSERIDHFSQIQTDADAILFVSLGGFGYIWQDSGFAPYMTVFVELFNTRSKNIIYSRLFCVESPGRGGGIRIGPRIESVCPDAEYNYESFGQLMHNFDEAIGGLIDCQNKIAVRIAEHLK